MTEHDDDAIDALHGPGAAAALDAAIADGSVFGEVQGVDTPSSTEPVETPLLVDVSPSSGADPLTVGCPDCQAPAGEDCRGYLGTHADRQKNADLHALDQGICALCGAWMVHGSVEGSPVDAWHPLPEDAAACPPMPDPSSDWNAYAAQINAGLSPGHPGVQHFTVPDPRDAEQDDS